MTFAIHAIAAPTYLMGAGPATSLPSLSPADTSAASRLGAGREGVDAGSPPSLDALLLGAMQHADATTQHALSSIHAIVPPSEAFDEGEDEMIKLQSILEDFSIAVALQSALARKGVNAIETLIKS